jgi:hypothetical protein
MPHFLLHFLLHYDTVVFPVQEGLIGFSTLDPVLTQNPKKAGRAGRKQWKIRRANGGKKHKSELK